MKKTLLRSAVALAVSSLFTVTSSFAFEQPNAADLVGKIYGGIHLTHVELDSKRWLTSNRSSALNNANGLGGEFGYRATESTEFRFGFDYLILDAKYGASDKPNAGSLALDVLYFPTEQNFYLLAGASQLDVVDSQLSSNLGLGYRHYLNEKSALYFETKAHYQFENYHDDYSAQLGFTYFFGKSNKSAPKKAVAVAAVATAAVSMIDTDGDGVADALDKCTDSAVSYKVDAAGCTVYLDDVESINLLVNFDNNKADVKPEYFNKIEAVAKFLDVNGSINVVIEGHASSQGNSAVNQTLSQKRAEAVLGMLTNKHGVDASRLSAIGYGDTRLMNAGDSVQDHAENRRIIATMSVDKKTPIMK